MSQWDDKKGHVRNIETGQVFRFEGCTYKGRGKSKKVKEYRIIVQDGESTVLDADIAEEIEEI